MRNTLVMCFPGYQPASSLLVVLICCCYGENKSISHGYQPVPRSGSAIEIQDQVLKIPSKNCEKRISALSFRGFLVEGMSRFKLACIFLLSCTLILTRENNMGRKVYDLFTFPKMTKYIINIEVGRSTLQGVVERCCNHKTCWLSKTQFNKDSCTSERGGLETVTTTGSGEESW